MNREVVGREGAAAPAGFELQLGRGAWRAAHGPTAWGAAGAGGAKGGDGSRCRRSGPCCRVGGAGCPSKEKAVLRRRLPCQMVGPRAARAARLRGAGAPDLAGRRGREGTPPPVRRHEHTGG